MLAYSLLNFGLRICGGLESPTTCDKASQPKYTASMDILTSYMVGNAFRAIEAASHNPCISLSGMEASVWLILVLSTNFDMVFMRLVLDLFEVVSHDTR